MGINRVLPSASVFLRFDEGYVYKLPLLNSKSLGLWKCNATVNLGDLSLLSQSNSVARHSAPLELERLQVLDQILLLLLGQLQPAEAVVVVNDLAEVRKTAVVVEAGLWVAPESGEGRGAVHVCG